ncbi:hypothetical protein SESBI_22661 [Sesbania bispinosa]|nr:hypothetical protein SESBI_22661 [Sesbania bispinosa]
MHALLSVDFGSTMENTDPLAVTERESEIWFHSDPQYLLHLNDASMFYVDFSSLPDFPCMSSSSPAKISQPTYPNALGDCMDMTGAFGYNDLLEKIDFFDPTSVFQKDEKPLEEFTQEQSPQQEEKQHPIVAEDCELVFCTNEKQGKDDEMRIMFLEWLKSNKDSVSANDLRSVKFKKATIESAAKRLGGGKEGMKQLLKLILEWVQKSHLQKNKRHNKNTPLNSVLTQYQDTNPASNLNPSSVGPELSTPWISPPMVGVVGDSFMRLGYSSASKEARKKRMAKQRRNLSHYRNHIHHSQQQNL